MNSPISGIGTSGVKVPSQVTAAQTNQVKKADSGDSKSKSTSNQIKTDTIQLSAAATAKSKATTTTTATATSPAMEAKQLYRQGQTAAQIAAKLGIPVSMVDTYLGISSTATNSTSNTANAAAAAPQTAATDTTPEKANPKLATEPEAPVTAKK